MLPRGWTLRIERCAGARAAAALELADNRDLVRNPMEIEEPEPIEEYVPGIAGGRHYMAKLCHLADGPWYIEVIHVESLPPLHDSDGTWPTRAEAVQAADKLVAALGH